MSFEISCPGCRQTVALADDPLGEQTCPHCQAVFRLQAVLVDASPAEQDEAGQPPSEEQTEAPSGEIPSVALAEDEIPSGSPQDEPEIASEDRTERPESFDFAEPAAALSNEQNGAAADQEQEPADEAASESPDDSPDQPDEMELHLDQQEDQETEEAGDYWASLEQAESDAEHEPGSLVEKARSLSRRQGPSPLVHLLGIIGSGFLGLAIGYYLLNYLGGPRFNFLNIPLPGIPHTQQSDLHE